MKVKNEDDLLKSYQPDQFYFTKDRKVMNYYGKRYYSYSAFLKNKFGTKIGKVSIDAGFTCPNRDGTLSKLGCIFCGSRGSGDFSPESCISITKQIEISKTQLFSKWKSDKFIVYFQPYTNTYASLDILKNKYEEALAYPGVIGLSIATRPDCINDGIINLLQSYSEKYYISIELGLQTIHENSALFLNRKYDLSVFDNCIRSLNQAKIDTVVHLIFGLPGETKNDMLDSVKYLSHLPINGVKLHLLYILSDTKLNKIYQENTFELLSEDQYIDIVCNAIGLLPRNFVIHRLTGDAPKDILIAPLWSKNKREILNKIENNLSINNIIQGCNFKDYI